MISPLLVFSLDRVHPLDVISGQGFGPTTMTDDRQRPHAGVMMTGDDAQKARRPSTSLLKPGREEEVCECCATFAFGGGAQWVMGEARFGGQCARQQS
jgi:hypothetical protein